MIPTGTALYCPACDETVGQALRDIEEITSKVAVEGDREGPGIMVGGVLRCRGCRKLIVRRVITEKGPDAAEHFQVRTRSGWQ